LSTKICLGNLPVKNNKKVFVSSSSDRGILVKFLKNDKVSLSFWGNDDPKNISYSKEEIEKFCEYILGGIKKESSASATPAVDFFNQVCEEMISRIPPKQKL